MNEMEFLHNRALFILRISLGLVFVWFGILKFFNTSPVQELIMTSFPKNIGQSNFFIFSISIIELLIGLSFLMNKLVKFAATIMVLSLFAISVPVFVKHGFDPRFPDLSLAGEFIIKNLVLIAAGFVLIAEKDEKIVNKNNYKQAKTS